MRLCRAVPISRTALSRTARSLAVMVHGTDEAELRRVWEGLSSGATVAGPLEPQLWGDIFGMCIDECGVTWQVKISRA